MNVAAILSSIYLQLHPVSTAHSNEFKDIFLFNFVEAVEGRDCQNYSTLHFYLHNFRFILNEFDFIKQKIL